VYLQPEEVKQFWNLTKVNDLIVIDETQKYFSARNWQSKDNNDFAMWVTEHRHNGQDLLLISPKATQIDGYVRGMVQWVYSYRKLSMFGSLGAKKYIRFCFYEDDKKPLSRVVSNYEKSIFNCYASYFAGSAKEVPIEENANILKHPVFIALALVIVLFGWTFARSGIMQNGIFGNKAIDTGKLLIEQRQKEISEKSEKKPDPGALPEGNQSTNSEQKIERVAMGVIGSKTLYKDSTGKVTFE